MYQSATMEDTMLNTEVHKVRFNVIALMRDGSYRAIRWIGYSDEVCRKDGSFDSYRAMGVFYIDTHPDSAIREEITSVITAVEDTEDLEGIEFFL
jgi:hypothetical protein